MCLRALESNELSCNAQLSNNLLMKDIERMG